VKANSHAEGTGQVIEERERMNLLQQYTISNKFFQVKQIVM